MGLLFFCSVSKGDLIYGAGNNLLQETNGAVQALNTGFAEHNFISVSDDGRFVLFSSPDPVQGSSIIPSSDIYSYDRVTRTTRRIVDHVSSFDGFNTFQFLPASATLSPNNQLVAYGTGLITRQGNANPSRGVTLAVARSGDGVIIDNPAGTNPVSDDLGAAYVGLDWDPGGNSFVTPAYVPTISSQGLPTSLPAIVRFARQGNGSWTVTPLTTPAYFDNVLPPQARTYIYPALSPSGAGLAYFSMSWPDILGSSQPVTARLVVANSDGSNPFVVFTFNAGIYPAGLSWSRDGTQLIVSFANQASVGTGFLPSANLSTAVVRSITISNGAISNIAGVNAGFFPVAISGQSSPPQPPPQPPPSNESDDLCFPLIGNAASLIVCL